MSEQALKYHNMLLGSERKIESPENGTLVKKSIDNATRKLEECLRKSSAVVAPNPANGNELTNGVGEVGTSEIEYIESEKLSDVEDADAALKAVLAGLESKDWLLVCDTLNNVRRLALFHKEVMLNMVEDVITLLVKALKNPRSAVCKTGIMTSADIFFAYNDELINFLDPLMVQLLLKASQDKKFVCEAAEKALVAMTSWVSPALLLPKLKPYLKNRNPRIRAKASMCFCRSVPLLGGEGIKAYGIDELIQTAASQLSDQLPESREAARTLLLELQTVYEKSPDYVRSSSL